MFDYRNNERCSRYQRGQTKDYAQIAELVERRAHDTLSAEAPCMLAVARKETNEMIGEIVVVPKDNTISLGYTFSYQYHRHGYAFEALSALIDLLHQKAPDREFVCFTDPQNAASMGLLLKLGYQDLGYVPSMESQAFGKWTKKSAEEKSRSAAGRFENKFEDLKDQNGLSSWRSRLHPLPTAFVLQRGLHSGFDGRPWNWRYFINFFTSPSFFSEYG